MLHILNRLISSLIVFQVYIEFKMPLSVNSQLDNKIPPSLVGKFYKQFAYLTCWPLDRIDAPKQAAVSTSRQLVDTAALRHFNQSDGKFEGVETHVRWTVGWTLDLSIRSCK